MEHKFPTIKTYREPSRDDLRGMYISHDDSVDLLARNLTPSSPRDNRDVARAILYSLNADEEITTYVLSAVDSGYYKISDGMSWFFWRRTPISIRAGLVEDLAYWAHDYAYYIGMDRKKADELLYKTLTLLLMPKWKAWLIYRAVRTRFGQYAYDIHAAKRNTIPAYGTVFWIQNANKGVL